jgi:hypothetical protein
MERNRRNLHQSINLKIPNRELPIDSTQISGRFSSKFLDFCKLGVFGKERIE